MSSRRYLALTLLVGYVLAQASAWLGHDAAAHACRDGHTHSHCVSGVPHEHAEASAPGERLQAAAAHAINPHARNHRLKPARSAGYSQEADGSAHAD